MADKLVRLSDVMESANRHRMYASANRESVNSFAGFIKEIESIPAVDAVEVVRCRECRHRDPEDHKCDSGELERAGCIFIVNDDYFCAHGERREKVRNG